MVCKFGMPKNILSDYNPRFVSEFWTTLMVKSGAKVGLFSSYYQQTDRQSGGFQILVEQILWYIVAPL